MQRPSAHGLFLCQEVARHDDGRRTLFGMFDSLTADAFPCVAPRFTVYAALTDGQGRVPLNLTVTDIDNEIELLAESFLINMADPLGTSHLRIRSGNLVIPESGEDLFELHCENELICHRRLRVEGNEVS